MKRLLFAAALATGALPAAAAGMPKGDFNCFDMSSLPTISSELGGVSLNNFMLAEEKALTALSLKQVKLSYSLTNRSAKTAYVSVDLILSDASDNPMVAISASPPFGMMAASGAETVNSWTYVNDGTLAKAKRFCARVSIAQ